MATTETIETLKEKIVALQVKVIDTELQAGRTEEALKVMKVEMANKSKDHDEDIVRANGQGAAMAVQLNDVLERMIEKDQEIQTFKKDVQECMFEKDKEIQTVKEEIEKVKTGAKESATGDKPKGQRPNLVNPTETIIGQLPETITRADFVNWIDNFYMHPDGVTGWKGTSSIIKKIRAETEVVDPAKLVDIAMMEEINLGKEHHEDPIKYLTEIDKELYSYIFRKLNTKLKSLVDGMMSGFEVIRVIVREQDPVTIGAEFGLELEFANMAYAKCTDLSGARKTILELDRKIRHYHATTGGHIEERQKAIVRNGVMDSETAKEVRRKLGPEQEKQYGEVKRYIEELYHIGTSRKVEMPSYKSRANSLVTHYREGEQPTMGGNTQEWPYDLSAIKGGKGEHGEMKGPSPTVAEASGISQRIVQRPMAALPSSGAMRARGVAITHETMRVKREHKWEKASHGAKEPNPVPNGRARANECGEAKARRNAKAKVDGIETRKGGLKVMANRPKGKGQWGTTNGGRSRSYDGCRSRLGQLQWLGRR